jgi:hypothetical protein
MFVCPSIFDAVSMGTPFVRAIVVANVCLATCELMRNVQQRDIELNAAQGRFWF